jgi:hypothetical protein
MCCEEEIVAATDYSVHYSHSPKQDILLDSTHLIRAVDHLSVNSSSIVKSTDDSFSDSLADNTEVDAGVKDRGNISAFGS